MTLAMTLLLCLWSVLCFGLFVFWGICCCCCWRGGGEGRGGGGGRGASVFLLHSDPRKWPDCYLGEAKRAVNVTPCFYLDVSLREREGERGGRVEREREAMNWVTFNYTLYTHAFVTLSIL